MIIINPAGMGPAIPTIGETAVEIVKEDRKIAWEELERLKIKLEGAGARYVETEIAEGDPSLEIVTVAAEKKVNLIIMSTHGRSGLGRVLLGSVADSVVRHAPCPVLLVRARKNETYDN